MTRKFIPVEESFVEWHQNLEFVKEYDALEDEFALASQLIGARHPAISASSDPALHNSDQLPKDDSLR